MKSISIIIPVYNAEQYIKTCLDSILKQTFCDYELILVDDGSTDGTFGILQAYAKEDSRIIILNQKNQFAGVARNKGMERAQGKYVLFLDADDFFESNMLENIYSTAEKYNAQIVKFYCYYYDDESNRVIKAGKKVKKTRIVSAKDLGKSIFSECGAVPWDKLYLRSYLSDVNIQYQNLRNNNDEYFTRMIVAKAERIVLFSERFVYYRVNNRNSLQGNANKDLHCIALALAKIKKGLEEERIYEGDLQEAYLEFAGERIRNSIGFTESGSNESRKRMYEYLKDNVVPEIFDSMDEISDDDIIKRLLNSDDYEDFLIKEIQRLKENSVSKDSMAYRLGYTLLLLPRRILGAIRWLIKSFLYTKNRATAR